MSRKYLRNALAGAVISLAITLIVFNIFKVSPQDILSLKPSILALAIALNLVRFGAQGLRLHLLLRKFSSMPSGYLDSFIIRGASEFFALTTIPFMADEAARTWLLTERGEQPAKAFWVSFTEMLLDILVGASIALAAGLQALTANIHYLGLVILAISSTQLLIVAIFLWMALKSSSLAERIAGVMPLPRRVRRWLIDSLDDMGRVFAPLLSRPATWTFTWLMLSTLIVLSAPALTLYLMLGQGGFYGFTASLFTFQSGNALGVLPVTVGGSGLTEAGVYLYLKEVYGNDAAPVVIQWRLATYHLSLIISGLMFAIEVVGMRRTRQ